MDAKTFAQAAFRGLVLSSLVLLCTNACGPVLPFVVPASSPIDDGTTPAKESITFGADWKADPAKGGWSTLHAVRSTSISANSTTWHGLTSARVEVRPGDDPLGTSGERAEVSVMKNRGGSASYENASSGTVYYAVSYMLPTDWRSVATATSGWSVVFELHGPDSLGYSPAFTLNAENQYSVTIHAGDLPSDTAPGSFYDLAFSDPSLNLGRWTDFVIAISFSPTATGKVDVWRRNEGQSSFTHILHSTGIETLQFDSRTSSAVGNHYWKQGLYRSDSATITNVLWMGPSARGASFRAVERAAFGTSVGPP